MNHYGDPSTNNNQRNSINNDENRTFATGNNMNNDKRMTHRTLQQQQDNNEIENNNAEAESTTNDNGGTNIIDRQSTSNSSSSSAFLPSFEGFLTLSFSIHFSNYQDMNVLSTTTGTVIQTEEIENQLDTLMILFLCSRDVEIVIPPFENMLHSVCPFQEQPQPQNRRHHRSLAIVAALETTANRLRRFLNADDSVEGEFDADLLILWNVHKVEHKVVDARVAMDHEEDEENYNTVEPIGQNSSLSYYYIVWNFTYPVYQWGEMANPYSVQMLLDQSIREGTFDSALPWKDAQASVVGEEMDTFWGDGTVDDDAFSSGSDTNVTAIPYRTAKILQGFGTVLIVANTVAVLLLTILAKRHRTRKERKAKEGNESGPNHDMPLGTEEGVSEMLLESKQFAMEQLSSVQQVCSGRIQQEEATRNKEGALVAKAVKHEDYGKKDFSQRLLPNLSMDDDDDHDDHDHNHDH
jgi:hypothetical protein